MTNIKFDDVYSFLKKNGIIVFFTKKTGLTIKDKSSIPLENNKFNKPVNVAFKTGEFQSDNFKYGKSDTFNFALNVDLYRIILTKRNPVTKQIDKKIVFGIKNIDADKCWVKYLIDKDISYAEAVREQSERDANNFSKWLDNQDVITLEDAQKREKVEHKLKVLQSINKYASKYIENFAKQFGERE